MLTSRHRTYWLAVLLLNVIIAALLRAGAPVRPVNSDRDKYELVGRSGLAPDCPVDIYCYRILVPMALEQLPVDAERRWRWYEQVSATLAGFILAVAVWLVCPLTRAPVLASIIAQTAFGFAYTAYDPYAVDPTVFVIASLMTVAWLADWPLAALGLGVIGVFAKETVALIALSAAVAGVWTDVRRSGRWVLQAVAACFVLLGFHAVMDLYAGWSISGSPAAEFSQGSWLWLWFRGFNVARALLLFSIFGVVWIYALVGFTMVHGRLRALAVGAIVPMLALNYVQNPERALANAFFVVIPLAVVFLARLPLPLALVTTVANGLLTAKVGSSTTWLPPARFLLPIAMLSAVWALAKWRRDRTREPDTASALRPTA